MYYETPENILHQNGDIAQIQNYRSINLLSHIYKLLIRIMTAKLELYKPTEQAGLRKDYGTDNHLQKIKIPFDKN